MKKLTFLVFGEDFARHPHALEHLLRPLFSDHQFFWIETIGLRSPRLSWYDLKRIVGKLATWFWPSARVDREKIEVPANVTILSPLMIPFNQFRFIRWLNKQSVKRSLVHALREQEHGPLVTITSVPNAADYVGLFNEKFKLYYCVDEFSLWPGLDLKLVQKLESDLLKRVDRVVATSMSLSKAKAVKDQPTPILSHGVDLELFRGPTEQRAYQGIINCCYMGLFDQRSDQVLLLELLEQNADLELHIIGKRVVSADKLMEHPRVTFHGPKPYRELPSALHQMDWLILPYVRSELTESINPLKLKEYMASGRPTLSTRLPEVAQYSEYVYLGDQAADFSQVLSLWREGKLVYDAQKTLQFLEKNETWEAKSRVLMSMITDALNLPDQQT